MVLADNISNEDSALVKRIKKLGGIILGKTTMMEAGVCLFFI